MEMTFTLLGGIGLFLLGMVLLTDGLKAFAGDALRRVLVSFTGTPAKAFTSGALVTAVIQSSSATTVTLIGFVSAGLLSFPQAVGVVFGASLGTTSTGWIVSALGLKIRIGAYALPLVGIGAFLRLLGRGRWKSLGLALAGFGLIFVGIATLQDGMSALASTFELSKLPSGGLRGRAAAFLVGFVLTVLMQSSSAAVATVLTALHMEAVRFEQAALLTIGAAVGTTVKGALVAIGANVPARRTALAHVLFNLATGLIAIALLPAFLWALGLAQRHLGLKPGAASLAAFHTGFIALGVALFLPFTRSFSRRIERLLPDKGPRLTAYLDDTVLNVPSVALEATRRALCATARETFAAFRPLLAGAAAPAEERRQTVTDALDRIREFLASVPPVAADQPLSQWRLAQLHAIDHLLRLQSHLTPPPGIRRLLAHERLRPAVTLAAGVLDAADDGLRGSAPQGWQEALARTAQTLADLRRETRATLLDQTASGRWPPAETLDALDASRWLDGIGYHAWRLAHYLGNAEKPGASPGPQDTRAED